MYIKTTPTALHQEVGISVDCLPVASTSTVLFDARGNVFRHMTTDECRDWRNSQQGRVEWEDEPIRRMEVPGWVRETLVKRHRDVTAARENDQPPPVHWNLRELNNQRRHRME